MVICPFIVVCKDNRVVIKKKNTLRSKIILLNEKIVKYLLTTKPIGYMPIFNFTFLNLLFSIFYNS